LYYSLILLFPIIEIDGNYYTQRTINELNFQRQNDYKIIYSLVDSDIDNYFSDQLNIFFEMTNKYKNTQMIISGINKNIIPVIILDYYSKLQKIDKDYIYALKNNKSKFIFPLQHRIKSTFEKAFPPINTVTDIDGVFYDLHSINLLIKRTEYFNKEAIDRININVDDAIDEYKNDYFSVYTTYNKSLPSLYNTKLFDAIQHLDTISKNSFDFYKSLLNECYVAENNNLHVSKISTYEEIITPFYMDVIRNNDSFYYSYATTKANMLFDDIRNDWSNFKNSIIVNLINNNIKNILEYIDTHIPNPRDKIDSEVIETKGYKYYNSIVTGNYFNNIFNQCKISSMYLTESEISDTVNLNPVPVQIVNINEHCFDTFVIETLQYNMELLSSKYLDEIKYTSSWQVNNRANICVRNVDAYINWYYSVFTNWGRFWERILYGKEFEQRSIINKYYEIIYSNLEGVDSTYKLYLTNITDPAINK
jgi:hypothetical protein